MKKIINHKLYNTDTATLLAVWDNSYFPNDFNYICEELYQKKNGEYFLYGTGGPLTHYCVPCGSNSYSGSAEIIPLSLEEAKDWVETNADADTYIRCFGDVDE